MVGRKIRGMLLFCGMPLISFNSIIYNEVVNVSRLRITGSEG